MKRHVDFQENRNPNLGAYQPRLAPGEVLEEMARSAVGTFAELVYVGRQFLTQGQAVDNNRPLLRDSLATRPEPTFIM